MLRSWHKVAYATLVESTPVRARRVAATRTECLNYARFDVPVLRVKEALCRQTLCQASGGWSGLTTAAGSARGTLHCGQGPDNGGSVFFNAKA